MHFNSSIKPNGDFVVGYQPRRVAGGHSEKKARACEEDYVCFEQQVVLSL